MSLRRSSCRILSWLLRAGKVRMGPPRLSLPPANKHMRTIRHQGEDAAPEARRRPASPPPAQPKRPSRGQCPAPLGPAAGPPAQGGCPRTLSPSYRGSVSSLLQFYGWREKGSRSRASFALNFTSSHPLCVSSPQSLCISLSLCLSFSVSLFSSTLSTLSQTF